jgi:nicotinamide riboside kinase
LIEKQEDLENEMGSFITDSSFIIQSAYNWREYNWKKYDLNFYLPPEIEIKKDWIRNEEKEYQKQIDEKIKEIYKKYNIKYIEITGNIQERVEKILLHINMILFYNEEKNAKK